MKTLDVELYTDKSFLEDTDHEIIRKHLDLTGVERTLEVGCCDGELSHILEKMGIEAWGTDLKDYHLPLKHFVKGDFLTLEFPENYFDVVVDVSAIHHFGLSTAYGGLRDIDGDIHTSERIFRYLKPGGHFYLSMDRFKLKYDPDIQNLGFVRQYNLEEFKKRLCKNFKIIEMKYYSYTGHECGLDPIFLEVVYAHLKKP